MSKFFGKTWWGEQWLHSLTNIDYDNRLPRGVTYARNGAVSSIKIEENIITAKVRGSRPKPYDVMIVIPPFFENGIEALIEEIAERPFLISKLLNRELDPEVLSIAGELGLKVFPKQWTDFKMQCSCPDWAVPCKHLAAVVYKVSAEIDNNPFLVFSLHRLNIAEHLQKKNILIQQPDKNDIPDLKSLLVKEKAIKDKKVKKDKSGKEGKSVALNMSAISAVTEPLIQLLADNPAFHHGSKNFKESYAYILRRIVRNAEKIVLAKTPIGTFLPVFNKIQIGPSNFVTVKVTADYEVRTVIDGKSEVFVKQLIPLLWNIPSVSIDQYQPSVIALKTALQLSLNLLAKGAVVPQIFQLKNKKNAVRWLPAMLSKEVKLLTEQFQQDVTSDIYFYEDKKSIPVDNELSANILSAFLSELIPGLNDTAKSDDTFLKLFFEKFSYTFNGPGEQALSGGIQMWLQKYYLAQEKYKPVIIVDELKNENFGISLKIQDRDKVMEKPFNLADVLNQKKYEAVRYGILQSLAQLSAFIPGLDQYINSNGKEELRMNMQTFGPFLMNAIPAIKMLDISILLPKSLEEIIKPKGSLRVKSKPTPGNAFIRLDKLLDFDWQVSIGNDVLDQKEFSKLVNKSEGLIKYKTSYIYVNSADIEKLHKHFSQAKNLSPFEILRTALSNDYYGAKVLLTDEIKKLIKELTTQKNIALPENLNAVLRPYQQRGYSWLYSNAKIGFGCVLADDMGLGKTLQVITTMLKYKEEGVLDKKKILIVAPTGLLTNWQAEFTKFAPSMNVRLYHGSARQLDKKEKYDVLLTTYGVVRSDADVLKKLKWHVVVTDEAQNIKNHEAAQSKAIKSIPADTFIAMSGTPVENRLSELWSIMDFSNRGFLGNIKEFNETFAVPIQNQNDIKAAEKLKNVSAPFVMRRLKSDKTIISDLPDKIEMDCFSHLAPKQAALYEKTLEEAMDTIENMSTDKKSLFVRQGLVLQMILALKQICNHPTNFLKNKVYDPSLSGKAELLFDKLDSIVEAGEKVLVFTQFKEMGDLLKRFITERFGEEPLFYHGGCSLKERKEMVESFQTNKKSKIFILSLKAAGTGLNLTAANHVIHYDLWWNPAVEAQATDRAYRIGQKSNVMVHRFITKGTFEERINEMIQSKKALAELTVNTGENWIGNLSNKELKELFTLGV